MIRRGQKLHSLYPAKLEDHLLADFGRTDFEVCLQTCAIPRWFNFDILRRALSGILDDRKISKHYEKILDQEYVKKYGDTGFCFADPERYYFLNFAFSHEPTIGAQVLDNISDFFGEMSSRAPGGYDELRSRGYYDSRGAFEIEYLYLLIYDANKSILDSVESAFKRFLRWRADPSFNHSLNRRLVKALRDHVKTGLIADDTSLAILELMEYSTPPWSDRTSEKVEALSRAEPYLAGVRDALPFFMLERAKSMAATASSIDEDEVRGIFRQSRELFREKGSVYYVAETLRQEGKFFTLIDEFSDADDLLRRAIDTLEDTKDFPSQYMVTIHECWRLVAWNQLYKGGEGIEIARSIAENKYLELLKSGNRYMTSLFGILLAHVRATDPNFFDFGELFFDTSEILDDAISNLVAIPDSVDYANALFQRLTFDVEYFDSPVVKTDDKERIASEIEDRFFETRTCYDSLGSDQGLANVSYYEGRLYFASGEYSSAKKSFELALDTYSSKNDHFGQLNTLMRLGFVALTLETFGAAVSLFSKAWEISCKKDWQDRYERNLAKASSKHPELQAGLLDVDLQVRGKQ